MLKKTYALMEGDCLELLKRIPDGKIDLVLTDPPYGTTACKWDSIIPLESMWSELKRVTKPNAAIVMTAGQPFTTTLIASNYNMFKYCWVWEKTTASGHLNAKKMPLKAHEDIVVFVRKGVPTYNPQKTKGHEKKEVKTRYSPESDCYGKQTPTSYSSTERYPRSVIKTSTDTQKSKLHPTQKPVILMEYLIKTYSDVNDVVLDFTMGSGTTGVAASNLGRRFIGIERDPKYFEIAKQRISEVK